MPQSLDIDSLIREKGSEILQFLQQKQEEMDITNADLMERTKIPQTSFYRIWNGDGTKVNADHLCRLCLILGVSIDAFQRDPSATSTVRLPGLREDSHAEIIQGLQEEITRQKETVQQLTEELEAKNAKIAELKTTINEKVDELCSLQQKYSDRVDKLTDSLIERHDQMHELNKAHNVRVDRLIDEILKVKKEER
jgi:DNA-binding Xre family transcriptional regulator